jgi:hypothetical protein
MDETLESPNDEQEAEHADCLNNYYKEGTGNADYQHRVLLDSYTAPFNAVVTWGTDCVCS